jgi:anti-sigma factor RsiW
MDLAAGEHFADLGAYALGGLDPAAAAAVRRHAAHCGDCTQHLEEFAEVTALLDLVPLEALLDGSIVSAAGRLSQVADDRQAAR